MAPTESTSRADRLGAQSRWGFPIGLLTLVLGAGCAREVPLAEVEGYLYAPNKKPLVEVHVEYNPVVPPGSPRLPTSRGTTDAQGRFRLVCENGQPGAVLGEHRITLLPRNPRHEEVRQPLGPSVDVPPRYRTVLETPLTQKVEPTKNDHVLVMVSP